MFRTDLGDLWRLSIISDWCACTPPSSRPELDLENVKAQSKRSATDRGCWSVIFRLASAPGCPIPSKSGCSSGLRVSEEVVQDEPLAGRPFADSSGFTDVARIHKYHEINAYHAFMASKVREYTTLPVRKETLRRFFFKQKTAYEI